MQDPSLNRAENNSHSAHFPWWLWAITAFAVLVPVAVGISRVLYPFDSGHYEGGLWKPAELMLAGDNPYHVRWAENPPFVMSPYGPVYYALLAVGIQGFGVQFWFGRLVSVVAMLICCWVVHRVLSLTTSSRDLAWFGVALFMAQMPIAFWSGLQRPDFAALALSLHGLFVLRVPISLSRSTFEVVLGAACFVAAFFCRQTALLPFCAALMWMLWPGRSAVRQAAMLFATFVGGAMIIFVAFNATSDGGFLWQQWVLAADAPKSLDHALLYWTFLFEAPVTYLVALIAVIGCYQLLRRKPIMATINADTQDANAWALIYLALASILAFVTTARHGSNLNYWLEPCALAAIGAPLTLHCLKAHARILQLCFLVLAASSGMIGWDMYHQQQRRWQGVPGTFRVVEHLRALTPPGQPILTTYPDLVVAAGRDYWFNDFVQYDGRSPRHRELMKKEIREGRVSAILSPWPVEKGYRYVPVPALSLKTHHLDLRNDIPLSVEYQALIKKSSTR